MKLQQLSSRSTRAFVALIAVYTALLFLLPASHTTKAEYNLSSEQYHALLLLVRLPILASWCVAYFGYRCLRHYAYRIQGTTDGNDFATISYGLKWIAWGLPIAALFGSLINAVANQATGFTAAAQIINGYPYVIITLIAFFYVGGASHTMAERSHIRLSNYNLRLFFLTLVAVSVLFCVLIASRLHGLDVEDSFNAYYLPNWLVWTTIVAPYMLAAFMGLFAVMEIMLIGRRTSGIIYSKALQTMAYGLVLIVLGLCALQYFRSVVPRTGHLTINLALITTYVIYAVNTLGWSLLAVGAKRLKRIEDL